MAEQQKNSELNDMLASIQKERDGSDSNVTSINDHADDSHSDILDSLEDDSYTGDDEQQNEEHCDTSNDELLSKMAENSEKVEVEKSKPKTKTRVIAVSVVAVACFAGMFLYQSGKPESQVNSVSLPSFDSWSLFGSTAEDDPVVTRSELEQVIRSYNSQQSELLQQFAPKQNISSLQEQLREFQSQLNQQKSVISSLSERLSSMNLQGSQAGASDKQLVTLKGELDSLSAYTGDLLSRMEQVDKAVEEVNKLEVKTKELLNANWQNHLRLNALEKQQDPKANHQNAQVSSEPSASAQTGSATVLKSAEKLTWNNAHPWILKIASERFTQIHNTVTNKPLRIYEGVQVPQCGVVLDIDIAGRKISTQHCTITRG